MDALLPVPESLYYNVSLVFVLYQCNIYNSTPHTDPEDPDVLWEEDEDEDVFETGSSDPSFADQLKQFFGFSKQSDSVEELKDASVVRNECVKILDFSHDHSLNTKYLLNWTGVTLVTCVIALLLWLLIYYIVKFMYRNKSKQNISCTKEDTASSLGLEDSANSETYVEDIPVDSSDQTEKNQYKLLHNRSGFQLLIYRTPSRVESVKWNTTNTKEFLTSTVDQFLRELDRTLGISSDSSQIQPVSLNPALNTSASSGAVSSLATPRLHRRSTWRRPRQGSPSLPLGDLSLMRDSQAAKDRFIWREVEKMDARLGWSLSYSDDIDFGNVNHRSLKDVLTFHIRNCPIGNGQFAAASLMVNYMLLLLEKELHLMKDNLVFRFVEFKGIGSVAKGLKISKSNQFDVAMVIQPTDCNLNSVLYHNVSEDIPPGKVIITVKDVKQDKRQKLYTRRASVVDSIGTYLLPKEVLVISKEMIDQALQRIMNTNKCLMDRLPFLIHTSMEAGLQLILDTRMLHGLGLGIPEIGIRLCPALPLMNTTLSMLPTLYAVTPWGVHEQKRRISSSTSMRIFRDRVEELDPDLLWSLSFCDLESSYLSTMDQKLQIAGITGCHRICLKIIKALFTSGYKTSLLSRGEIQSYQLETILFFLLLESAPSNWSIDKLSDRVSDSVHFLRSALQSMWLPSFFIHNPHLEKQMPALKLYPLLSGGRQDNLLANMKSETVEKILNFIEERLDETGLKSCIKEEYSSDMWEYEFFIFG